MSPGTLKHTWFFKLTARKFWTGLKENDFSEHFFTEVPNMIFQYNSKLFMKYLQNISLIYLCSRYLQEFILEIVMNANYSYSLINKF